MIRPLQVVLLLVCSLGQVRCQAEARMVPVPPGYALGEDLASDDFATGLAQWRVEAEPGVRVEVREGRMEIDAPGGCTVWFLKAFEGPVLIRYEALAVSAGGPNDRVSDLNCFWMATDSRNPADLFAVARSGVFSDYDQLRCYYVGLGANANTTTRFRRYVGSRGNRPLLPEHDLRSADTLLVPNRSQQIQLVAADGVIVYYRDGQPLFIYPDPEPYRSGYFAFRTVKSHFLLSHFRVQRLVVAPAPLGGSR